MGRRAVFLDRDGVLNRGVLREGRLHPPATAEEVEILPGVGEACRALSDAGFLLVGATNQPDVARGTQSRDEVLRINDRLLRSLPLLEIRTCFHDDADGCACRKPRPGLLLDAAREHGIDLARSFMVGDRWTDVAAGAAAGCRTLLIAMPHSERERCAPDEVVADLRAAGQRILPLVSIVTPALNAARFIGDTLASVRGQDYPRIEHVVVDGGSTDGTIELLRAAPGIVWTSGPDAGMYDAINTGLRMAQGDIVAYQNADDRYVTPDAVGSAVRYLLGHPETDVVYGDFRYIDEEGRPVPGGTRRSRPFDARMLLRYNFIPPHCTFLRTRTVKDEGLWLDPTLRYPGDWDWFVRMALAGKTFAHLDQVLSEFRRHDRSQTARVGWLAKLSEWRRICRKNRTSFPLLVWYETFYMPLRRRLGLAP